MYFSLGWVFVAGRAFLQLQNPALLFSCSVWASHCSGFFCCGAWTPVAWISVAAARRLSSCGSQALEHRLRSCGTRASLLLGCGIFPDQESNSCLLSWQAESLPLSHQGSPPCHVASSCRCVDYVSAQIFLLKLILCFLMQTVMLCLISFFICSFLAYINCLHINLKSCNLIKFTHYF